ncbi:LysE family translocator [Streptomyces sp. NBC_01142]|uniref:LysE family translocator n=1 Tax=Streptomyces sp. NBC_01142 TaxID=2975865 RepID=UPI0022594589|nr:LysE family translocator [Streptomyces sp. NBC_01142]MCX4821284.1 LysE family translocator [Streptomyces sp. NBC_01142]
MPSAAQLLVFAGASLMLVLVPGPNLVYILTRSVGQGRRAGLVSAAGVEAATLVHITAAALGVAQLVARSEAAFLVLKYAGAVYLAYLGIKTLRGSAGLDQQVPARPVSLWRTFGDGALVNLFNPKVTLFFLAFLPQFVTPGPAARTHMLVLGGVFFGIALALDVMYALAGGAVSAWLRRRPRVQAGQHHVVGCVYLALGVVAALPVL